jgi:glutamate mutase epsilon subunit
VEALQLGTVEVWVPKSAKRTSVLGTILPRRLSEGMARALKADRVLIDSDASRRRTYELRAARSEPGLEAVPEQPQITTSAGE